MIVSQAAGVRQEQIDSVSYGVPASPEGFITTVASHGIPARAVAIGLLFGTLNAVFSVVDELFRSGEITAVDVAPLGQAYVLPLAFGLVTQAFSYRRSRFQVAKI